MSDISQTAIAPYASLPCHSDALLLAVLYTSRIVYCFVLFTLLLACLL